MISNEYSKESPRNQTATTGAYHALYLVLGFLFGTIFWIFFPGRTCPDSESHIKQAVTHSFNAHHARFTSYLMSWLPNFEYFPNYAWFFLLNIVLALAFIPFLIRFTLSGRAPTYVVFSLTAILSLGASILLAPLTITIWKDALLNSLLIAMAIIAAVLLIGTNLSRRTKTIGALLGALLACAVVNVRPNGYLATIPLMAVYFFEGFRPAQKPLIRLLLGVFWTFAIPVLSVPAARVLLPATPADQEEHIMNNDLIGMRSFGADLSPDPTAPAELQLLAQSISGQPWQGAVGNCWEYQMPRDITHIKRLWLTTIMKHPLLYLRVRWTCFNGLLLPPQGRPPVAYSRTAFLSSPLIKEFFEKSPIRDQAISFFDSIYRRIAIGSIVLKVNLALLALSSILFFFTRDRIVAASAVITTSSLTLFMGYFFIITTGDFRFITWSLSAAVLSTILCLAFAAQQAVKGLRRLRTRDTE